MAENKHDPARVFAPNTRTQAVAYSQTAALYETVICFVCSHRPDSHYDEDAGQGCVGEPPRVSTLSNTPTAPRIDIGTSCSCPGYLQGQLPHAITKHLNGLAYEDEEIDCSGCGHGLDQHDEHYGCWSCPCEVNEHPND